MRIRHGSSSALSTALSNRCCTNPLPAPCRASEVVRPLWHGPDHTVNVVELDGQLVVLKSYVLSNFDATGRRQVLPFKQRVLRHEMSTMQRLSQKAACLPPTRTQLPPFAPSRLLPRMQLDLEAALHASLGPHPHIVPLYWSCDEDGRRHLATEYCAGGDLRRHLPAFFGCERSVCVQLLAPLLRALAHAHAAGIVHRDVKPDNVFMDTSCSSGEAVAKLGDFGLAVSMEEVAACAAAAAAGGCSSGASSSPVRRAGGTTAYTAPEVLQAVLHGRPLEHTVSPKVWLRPCMPAPCHCQCQLSAALPAHPASKQGIPGPAARCGALFMLSTISHAPLPHHHPAAQNDIWSLGLLALEALTGRHPFGPESHPSSVSVLLAVAEPKPLALPRELSDGAREWLAAALSKDPQQRATAEQLLAHPWLAGAEAAAEACASGDKDALTQAMLPMLPVHPQIVCKALSDSGSESGESESDCLPQADASPRCECSDASSAAARQREMQLWGLSDDLGSWEY